MADQNMRASRQVLGRVRQLLARKQSYNRSELYTDSVSGSDLAYLEACRSAVLLPTNFKQFRNQKEYTEVLEHVSDVHGREYFRLLSPARQSIACLREAAKNDEIGSPRTMQLDSGLMISPTTLRYLKVADDLERYFGKLDSMRIVEIGVGYGGQCRIIDSLFKVKSYTLVDLKPVLELAEHFLSHFPLQLTVQFRTMNELMPQDYDLAISNYAFTELSRRLQEAYCVRALDRSSRGYITYNDIAPASYNTMTADELRDRFGAQVMPEEPLTHPRNKIIVWGCHAA